MKLPSKKSKADVSTDNKIWLIYGAPGTGKTSLANSFGKNMLFLYMDPGVKVVEAYKEHCVDWKAFIKRVDAYLDDGDLYDGLALDTVDLIYDSCIDYYLKKKNIDHLSELEWSKGWDMVKREFSQTMAKLANSGKTLVYICHCKSEELRGRAVKTSKLVPALGGGGRKTIINLADNIGYLGYVDEDADDDEDSPRKIMFNPHEAREGKNRSKIASKVTLDGPDDGFAKIIASIGAKKKKKNKKSKK